MIMRKTKIKITPIYHKQPPPGIDINTILAAFMCTDYIPKDHQRFQTEYRKFVQDNKETTEGGKTLRNEN